MLYILFAKIIDMSIMATVVIAVVLIVRELLGKGPKKYAYLLWAIVGIRLLCPVGISSPFSIYNLVNASDYSIYDRQQTETQSAKGNKTTTHKQIDGNDTTLNGKNNSDNLKSANANRETAFNRNANLEVLQSGMDNGADRKYTGIKDRTIFERGIQIGAFVWITGCTILTLWNAVLVYRTRGRVAQAVRLKENIYECDSIPTPFVMGIIAPKIYIPFRLKESEQEYIISHEKYHIRRKDNIVKCIAFLLCVLHWFDPFVWLAYFFMIRDMEMSCDEYVLGHFTEDIRKSYSESLLGFATNTRTVGIGMLSFGESNTRRRVKNIMEYKKYGKWIGMFAVGLILIVATACLTDAKQVNSKEQNDGNEHTKQMNAKEKNDDNEYTKLLASAEIHGFQVEILYTSEEPIEEEPESGYYEGDGFFIQTSRNHEMVDCYALDLSTVEDKIMYFPVKGFSLGISDYDGNGEKDDFALGQGQTMDPILGNYMKYGFFGVDESGRIVQYHTSTEDGMHIATVPGAYSPVFLRKNGTLIYNGLGEEGVEETSTNIVRYIPLREIEDKNLEPEYSLMNALKSTMPAEVITELENNGEWHVSIGVDENGEEQICYSLANSNKSDTVSLRLDFTVDKTGNLVRYVSKDYGFVEKLSQEEGDIDGFRSVISFANRFLGIELVASKKNDNTQPEEGKATVWEEEVPERWKDGKHASFRDSHNNYYVVELKQGMVVYFETAQ